MDLVIEPGRPEDAPAAARLLADTDAGLFRLFGGDRLDVWTEIAEWEWRGARGIYCHDMAHVARSDGELVGLLISYSPWRDALIDWSLGCSRPHIEPGRMAHLDAIRPLSNLLFPAIPEEAYYVQNVAVDPRTRGCGLGRKLMERAFVLGRAEGCRLCHLDVDGSTPAVRFYERLGFRVAVRAEVPELPGIAAHLRMVRAL